MRTLLLFLGMSLISTVSISQMTGISWEVDAVSPFPVLEGYTTYKVFAEFLNPTDELAAIYSDVQVLGTSPLYVDAPCGCFNPELGDVLLGGLQNSALFDFFPEMQYDTYWTLGFATGEQWVGSNENYNSLTMCNEEETGGLAFTITPEMAGADLRIQIAQITTCGSFEMHACFQVFVEGVQAPYQEWCMDGDGDGPLAINPADFYGCTNELALNFDPTAFEDDGSCMYNGAEFCGPGTVWDETTLMCLPSPANCGAGTYWNQIEGQCLPFENCPEDLDNDGEVAVSDLLLLLSAYSTQCPPVEGCTDAEALNFNPNAEVDDGSCVLAVSGCTIEEACNFNEEANFNDGSCLYEDECGVCGGSGILDGACDCDGIFPIEFYTCEGECANDEDGDGVCDELEISGCTNSTASNFDASATEDDGSCVIPGCVVPSACNYNPAANQDDGSCASFDVCGICGGGGFPTGTCDCEGTTPESGYDCTGECLNDSDEDGICDEFEITGCDDSTACNYEEDATENDGSCVFQVEFYECDGSCTNDEDGDGVCDELEVVGCTESGACNYFIDATDDDGSCSYAEEFYDCSNNCLNDGDGDGVCDELELLGCTDSEAMNFEQDATDDDGSCVYAGCTIPIACNYNPLASVDDDSCEFYCPGCTDDGACNYDDGAIQDDGSCLLPEDLWGATYFDCEGNCITDTDGDGVCDEDEIVGCQLEGACNFLANATDEGECEYESCAGCTYEFACNYDPEATIADNASCEFGTCPGCTDDQACNFNPTVTEDDGSCIYFAEGTCDCDGNVFDECGVCGGDNSTCFVCGDHLTFAGHDYSTVQIGDQCWFAENLRTEYYSNGDSIPSNLTDGEWTSTTSGGVAVYGEDEGCYAPTNDACDPVWSLNAYGRLYNWYAVDDERGLCPAGWHVPSDGELMTLEMELGMSESDANSDSNQRGTDQATQMKSSPADDPPWDGTNSSGFSAVAGGWRYSEDGFFNNAGSLGVWWSSSLGLPNEWGARAWYRKMYSNGSKVARHQTQVNRGMSIRCLRDSE